MSLIIGGVVGSSVVLIGDSASGGKVAGLPSLNLLLGWVGYFNKPPCWLFQSGSAEYLNPNMTSQDFDESVKVLIDHVNSLDHMHGNRQQAALVVVGHSDGQPRTGIFETWGGKGSWPPLPSPLSDMFMVGCLGAFGVKSLTASLPEDVSSVEDMFRIASRKIESASEWLRNGSLPPCIAPPAVLLQLQAPGNTPIPKPN